MKQKLLAVITIVILFLHFPGILLADMDLSVTDNGSASSNSVDLSSTQSTEVTESNSGSVQNQVDANSTTGDNTSSQNVGNSQVNTGDSQIQIYISNQVNQSTAQINPCCPSTAQVTISGNGADSANQANFNLDSATNINVNNSINLTNHLNVSANTGNNSANQNSGSTSITTGDIYVSGMIQNKTNFSSVTVQSGLPSLSAKVSGNGANSLNSLNFSFKQASLVDAQNYSNVDNFAIFDLNTGENEANENLDPASIITGDIFLNFNISNLANLSQVIVSNCCVTPSVSPQPSPSPTPPPAGGPPSSAPGQNVSGGGDGGAGPAGAGAAGEIIGLAKTSGQLNLLGYLMYIIGLLCLVHGAKLLRSELHLPSPSRGRKK